MRINGAAFTSDYTDLQVVVFNIIEPINENAGNAKNDGIELEATFFPVAALALNFNLGLLDAGYTEIDPGTLIPADASLSYTPDVTMSGSAAYTADLDSGGQFVLRGDWSYRSSVFFDALNTPELEQPGYHLISMNAAYTDKDDIWKIALGVTNLTDKRFLIGGLADLGASSIINGIYARPREWYLTLTRNF